MATDAATAMAIGWQVGTASGWGTYGLNLAVQLARRGIEPDLRFLAADFPLSNADAALLRRPLRRAMLRGATGAAAAVDEDVPYPVLHALGEGLLLPPETRGLRGRPDVGVVFFESRALPEDGLTVARERLARVVTGSTWNTRVLADFGLTNAVFCPQGIAPALFHPPAAPVARPPALRDRFVVFSGGKLEYRKGQDLVVAAFRRFRERHPEALLITAWQNMWSAGLELLRDSAYVDGLPARRADGQLDMGPWFAANGLAGGAIDAGLLPNRAVPGVLALCDAAIFTSRCEGGTNLAAMEAIACGLPTILSANTGHHDLIAEVDGAPTALALARQLDIGAVTGAAHLRDWGESDVDEMVAALERLHADAALRQRIGAAGAAFLADWSWERQIGRLLDALAGVL